MAVLIVLMLFQILAPPLIWRRMRRRGWSKLLVFLAALPIPALVLARSLYLFVSAAGLADDELGSIKAEYELTAAFVFAAAAMVLYVLGTVTAWTRSRSEPPAARADKLKDVFE